MRRLPKSLLLAGLSRPLRPPIPAPAACPPPAPPPPRFLHTQTLAPAAAPKPAGLAFLEAAELHESEGDHRKALDLILKALAPLHESRGGWSLPVALALRLARAQATGLQKKKENKRKWLVGQ